MQLRCAYCHDDLPTTAGRVTCAACLTGLHADCWDLAGTCPTLGCAGPTPAGVQPPPRAGMGGAHVLGALVTSAISFLPLLATEFVAPTVNYAADWAVMVSATILFHFVLAPTGFLARFMREQQGLDASLWSQIGPALGRYLLSLIALAAATVTAVWMMELFSWSAALVVTVLATVFLPGLACWLGGVGVSRRRPLTVVVKPA